MSRPHTIPERSALLQQIQRANWLAGPWVVIQIALCVGLALGIDWRQIAESPLFSVIAVTVVVGPHVMSILRQYALQKKEIGELKEQTRFGEFDKYKLRDLVNDTIDRLGLPPPGPPVYITADKSMNAGSLHLGLGGFFRSLNGVYLNRQVLHRLTAEEVQDLIGHELGHFYKYYLLNQRFQGITLILGALAGILVTQWLGMNGYLTMVALAICGSAAWYVAGWFDARNGEAIEHLCDDLGAQVHGIVPSINGLLKVGADSELQVAIHQQEILNRRHENLNARDVLESITAAIPYGHTTKEELEKAVEESLKRTSQDRRNLTLKGFLEFAWQGDDEEALEEAMEKVQLMQQVPRLDWESLLDRPGHIALNDRQIAELVEMIEAHPDKVLFRLPEELGITDDVHPPIRSRILYLWYNREEIKAARFE